jgi:uroporphyrin-III C-methyltransferase
MKPHLTLIGAGPGDPGLLTLSGIRALESAEVVLHDALAGEETLKYIRPGAETIYVGKSAKQGWTPQQKINERIVHYAQNGKNVVRLKGGDPFIFGRGYEELQHAEEAGFSTEVIPGVSSVTGLAALHGIPLTHRGLAQSFWVATATSETGELPEDLRLAARSNATIVIVMGMSKLTEIVALFREIGKEDLPVAIITNGSLNHERVVIGNVGTILTLAREHGLTSPATIIIGKVVALREARNIIHNTVMEEAIE